MSKQTKNSMKARDAAIADDRLADVSTEFHQFTIPVALTSGAMMKAHGAARRNSRDLCGALYEIAQRATTAYLQAAREETQVGFAVSIESFPAGRNAEVIRLALHIHAVNGEDAALTIAMEDEGLTF